VRTIRGRGGREKVHEEHGFALMEPVVPDLEVVFDNIESSELVGQSSPMLFARRQDGRVAAQKVVLRPVEERLVEVIAAVT